MTDEQMFRSDHFEEDGEECPAAWIIDWLDDPAVQHMIEGVVDRLGCSKFEAVQLICARSTDLALYALVEKLAPPE